MEYSLAASKCEAALKQDPTVVGAMRYLAVINRALGKKTGDPKYYHQCIAWAEMYLRERPTGKFTDRMREELNACRKAVGQKELPKVETQGEMGALIISCDIEGATVSVDELKRGATPLTPIQVTPGRHVVTVYKFGYLPFTVTVDVGPKQIHEVKVVLQRDPNAPEVTAPPAQGQGGVSGAQGASVQPTVEMATVRLEGVTAGMRVMVDGKQQDLTPDGSFSAEPGLRLVRVEAEGFDPWERRVAAVRGQTRVVMVKLRPVTARIAARKWAWTLTAVAAATAATGLAFGLLENASHEKAEDLFEQGRRGFVPPDLRQRIDDAKSTGRVYGIAASVSLGASLAALGGAIFFWIREHGDERPRGEPPPLALTPTLLPRGGGLMLTREFGR